jgi:hypothetical protein
MIPMLLLVERLRALCARRCLLAAAGVFLSEGHTDA